MKKKVIKPAVSVLKKKERTIKFIASLLIHRLPALPDRR